MQSARLKVAFVLGTRPEIIKLFPVIEACRKQKVPFVVIHTNQHYDANLDAIFFKELGLAKPDYDLHIGSGTHGDQTGRMIIALEKVLLRVKPTHVVVQGDTNSVLAGALAAAKLGIRVAHVEAGLRSYDRSMPEELNRIATDHVADLLFPPTKAQAAILKSESIPAKRITVTGNTVVDALKTIMRQKTSPILANLGLKKDSYVLLTCHRPANTDDTERLLEIVGTVAACAVAGGRTCLLPLHPRLNSKRAKLQKIPGLRIIAPVGYHDLLTLASKAHLVCTDSGGLQEETCVLEQKCLILRTNTERPETVAVGGAILLKRINANAIKRAYAELEKTSVRWRNPFGDGKAGARIVALLKANAKTNA